MQGAFVVSSINETKKGTSMIFSEKNLQMSVLQTSVTQNNNNTFISL